MDTFPLPRPISPIVDAESTLEQLTRRAELEIQSQPPSTQIHLTKQTRQIFAHYTERGTTSSLHAAITCYFKPTNSSINNNNHERLVFSPPLPPYYVPPPPNPKDSRMVDEDSRNLVRDMPFRIDRKFHIRADVKLPEGLMEGIDRIFRIYQAEAEAMLSHHCEKYGDEAIFRVGIRSLLLSRSDTLLEATRSNPHRLDPETRLFFLQVYERHPDLNIAEKRLLARSARVGTEVVDAFWENLTHLRAPYLAMRTVIAARELRKQAHYTQYQARLQREREFMRQRAERMERLRRDKEKEMERAREREGGGDGADGGDGGVGVGGRRGVFGGGEERKTRRAGGFP